MSVKQPRRLRCVSPQEVMLRWFCVLTDRLVTFLSVRFIVWLKSLCWNPGMHIKRGWFVCLPQFSGDMLTLDLCTCCSQSSGPLCACWHSGLVSSATQKFSFSSGAHNLVCASRFCLGHNYLVIWPQSQAILQDETLHTQFYSLGRYKDRDINKKFYTLHINHNHDFDY